VYAQDHDSNCWWKNSLQVCGIDPGTSRWGFYGFEERTTILDRSISTSDWNEIQKQLEEICQLNFDCIIAPSGYGVPLKLLSDLDDQDRELLALWSGEGRIGINKSLKILERASCRVFVIPGVKHLSSVPAHRKINRVDLGTPDKVCAVAYSMVYLHTKLGIPFPQMNFVFAELGTGFNAFLRVVNGTIVDGIGGSNASFGFRSGGALDAEVAYLLGKIRKRIVFEGGVLSGIEAFKTFSWLKEKYPILWNAFLEGIMKDIARVSVIGPRTDLVLLSGKLANDRTLVEHVNSALIEQRVLHVQTDFKAGQAAVGAAYIAEGLHQGYYYELVKSLGLQLSSGKSIDGILYRPTEANSLLQSLRVDIENS